MHKANFMETIGSAADFFLADIRLNIFSAEISASRIFFGGFSADRNSAANPDIGCGWGLYLYDPQEWAPYDMIYIFAFTDQSIAFQ